MKRSVSVLLMMALLLIAGRADPAGAQRAGDHTDVEALPVPWQASPAGPLAPLQADGPQALPEPGYVENQLLVRFKPGTSDEEKAKLHAELGGQIIEEIPGLDVQVLRLYDDAVSMVSVYQAHSEVAYAEPNYLVEIFGAPDPVQPTLGLSTTPSGLDGPFTSLPNDPLYNQQWHHTKIGNPTAWDYSKGQGVVVAVIDTGVACNHADLAGKCDSGYDFVFNDSDPRDDHGHGTHVAGIVAAMTNNGVGVAAGGWSVRFMPLKALGPTGNGSHSDMANAIRYAADHGAHVINMSLGGMFTSNTLLSGVNYALARDVVILAAAGNENWSNPSYPAAYPGVISVAATTQSDTRASFSNYGSTIDIAAPGVGILSTVMSGSYQAWSGTSMACPVAAGLAALVKAQNMARTPAEIEELMERNAVDLGSAGWDQIYGWGRIDAAATMADGAGTGSTPEPGTPTVPPPPTAVVPTPTIWAGNYVQQVEDLINAERVGVGLSPLYSDTALRQAAGRHSGDMATVGFCGHIGSEGSTASTRMRDAGYNQPYGEIVACGQTTPAVAVETWMNSPLHQSIILCTTCTELGAGYAESGSGYRHYWTVTFGSEAVQGPTPTPAGVVPTTAPTFTPQPAATSTPLTPTPEIPPGGTEVRIPPANNRSGWVVSTQPNENHFVNEEDTFTGIYRSNTYHGALQFDLDVIPPGTHVSYARLELTGRSIAFLGETGTWSVNLLDTASDDGFASHGYVDIHGSAVEATLLPLLGFESLGANEINSFAFTSSQLAALQARVNGSRKASFRMDGPTSGTVTNLFTWDTGFGPETLYPGPQLVVHYTLVPPSPVPTETATEIPPPSDTPGPPTAGPSETPTSTPVPPTATHTPPPSPTPTATPTDLPTAVPTLPGGGEIDLVPAQGDVGWVAQNQPFNHLGDDDTYTGYYQGLIYLGLAQFNLSPIPPGSVIQMACLTLTGQDATFLSPFGNGLWHIRMLGPDVDYGWRNHLFPTFDGADVVSTLLPDLRQSDLEVGHENRWCFDEAQRHELAIRVSSTRKASFRFDGPRAGVSNIFSWDSGYGSGFNRPPVLSVIFGPPGSGEPTPTTEPEHLQNISAVIAAINRERAAAGVPTLTVDDALMRAAMAHNLDLAANNRFSHVGSDGSLPADRVVREGFVARDVGEILAGATGDVEAVIAAWLSRAQRDDVLKPNFTHIGAHYTFASRTSYRHYWTVKLAEAGP